MVAVNKLSIGAVIKHEDKFWKVENMSASNNDAGKKVYEIFIQEMVNGESKTITALHDENLDEVNFTERQVEFLYFDEGKCFFLDIDTLDTFYVDEFVVSHKQSYLKEGVVCKAMCCADSIFNVELPQFLELMVSKILEHENQDASGHSYATAILETGAQVVVPSFIEVGDIVKVDPRQNEYIQRI